MPGEVQSAAGERLQVAREAATEAGEMLVGRFRKPVAARFKRGDSMVSDADHESEALITRQIARAFPGDSILAEEGGFARGESDWCWTLDALDGTQNFLAGVPLFSVAIAAFHAGVPVMALVHDPMRGESYTALKGRGARRDGSALAVNAGALTPSSLIAVRHRFLRREADRMYDLLPTRKFRCFGSMSLELAYVAQGTIDLMLANRPHLWDIAPGGLLVEEAGGVVRGFDGEAVFPFTDEIAIAAEQRYRIVAGGVSAVESVLPHLRALPG